LAFTQPQPVAARTFVSTVQSCTLLTVACALYVAQVTRSRMHMRDAPYGKAPELLTEVEMSSVVSSASADAGPTEKDTASLLMMQQQQLRPIAWRATL
jgi:hypothetical protein